jgi:ADP-ribosylglycohydrolase
MLQNKIIASFLGFAIGDALGVPVEFLSRAKIAQNPVAEMREFGAHHQPKGTWSDDSSLAFCLADSLCKGYDLQDIAQNFVKWRYQNLWTAHGEVFDVGIATSHAIDKLRRGGNPLTSGGTDEMDNGNGSLMRILPLIFHTQKLPILKRFELVAEVSAITHGHIRSILACFIYTEFALELLAGNEKFIAYQNAQAKVNAFLEEYPICSETERKLFHKLLLPANLTENQPLICDFETEEIHSSGYVMHTLEASIWCFLKTNNYKEAVLSAVNLGNDTDTTGCITGGLAGLYYGIENIPADWQNVLARKTDIVALAEKLGKVS